MCEQVRLGAAQNCQLQRLSSFSLNFALQKDKSCDNIGVVRLNDEWNGALTIEGGSVGSKRLSREDTDLSDFLAPFSSIAVRWIQQQPPQRRNRSAHAPCSCHIDLTVNVPR